MLDATQSAFAGVNSEELNRLQRLDPFRRSGGIAVGSSARIRTRSVSCLAARNGRVRGPGLLLSGVARTRQRR